MKMVSSENLRKEITEIGNIAKYEKESCIVTKNNKPYFGIVPMETMQLLAEIVSASHKNKAIYNITKNYMINISSEDIALLERISIAPANMSKNLLNASKSIKSKFKNIE
jgi:hypothetical protein